MDPVSLGMGSLKIRCTLSRIVQGAHLDASPRSKRWVGNSEAGAGSGDMTGVERTGGADDARPMCDGLPSSAILDRSRALPTAGCALAGDLL